jgi:hypothetical protein
MLNNSLDSINSNELNEIPSISIKVKKNNIEKGKTVGELMISKIDHLYIGLAPLKFSCKWLHRLSNYFANFRKKFPNKLGKLFVHANIFLATKKLEDDNYDGILIEYGKYRKYRKNDDHD